MQFKFLNIPVTIHITFWWFLLFFCFEPRLSPLEMGLAASVVFFSLLFHEYGHALTAKKLRKDPSITLEGLGGYAAYEPYGLSDKQQFMITLSGPLFTAILIALSYYLLKMNCFQTPSIKHFLYYTMTLNTYWLIINLAPLYPLDGGKIFGYFLRKWFGSSRGESLIYLLGNITAICGALYFFATRNYVFAYLFLVYGWRNFQLGKAERRQKDPSPMSLYNQALDAAKQNNNKKAQALLKHLISSQDPYIQTKSAEQLANLLHAEGKTKEAYQVLLNANPEQLGMGKWLLCKLAYSQKNYRLVEQFSREIYTIHPTFETAMLNAKTFTKLGQLDYAAGWLNTSLQFEEAKKLVAKELLSDPDLAPLRDHPQLQENR